MVNFFNKKIIVVSIFIVGILNAENIEGRWNPGGFNNSMYEFVDGIRYTYYCADGVECDADYWDSLDTSDALPNPNPYWVDGNTLIIDLFFGNEATYTIGFRCDGQVVDFYYDEDDDWEGLHSTMFRLGFDDFNNDCLEPDPDDCLCTEEWDPVCGIDGNTYSNACFATCEYVVIAYEGECLVLNEEIEGRWHPVGFEENTMYQFEDGYRYTIYSTDGTFGGIEDAIPNPHPYVVDVNTISIDLHFGNIATYEMDFRFDGQVVDFYYDEDDDWEGLHSTMFREGFDYDDEAGDDGPPECITDCPDFELVENGPEDPDSFCSIIAAWENDSCLDDCEGEDAENVYEYINTCIECLSNDNCDEIFEDDDGCEPCDGADGCGSYYTEGECLGSDGCEWYGQDGPGCENCEPCDGADGCGNYYSEGDCWNAEGCEWLGWQDGPGCSDEECTDYADEWNHLVDIDSPEECETEANNYGFVYNCAEDSDMHCVEPGCYQHEDQYVIEWQGTEGDCVDDEGPPECIMDCGGCIEEDCEDDIEFCNWLVTLPSDECTEDCDEEILEELNEYVAECEECLADPENCGDDDNVTVDYNSGWNLVGLPLDVEDSGYSILYPESIEGTLYSFSGAYNPATNLINGEGYWLRFNESGSTTIYGTPIYELTINLNEGWNLISGLYEDISISSVIDPDGIITPGTLYGFSGSYVEADVLVSGNGYWLRAYQDGEVSLIVDGGPPEGVSYGSDIQPIFDDNCISCHINGGAYFGGLDLSTYENLMAGDSNSGPVVIVGDGANSFLIQKLEGTGGGAQMPQGGSPLPSEQINLISQWIDEGALNSRDNSSKDRDNIIQSANVLTINGFELFFGLELSSRERLSYSLPPKPPVGSFDVRFKDGWRHVKDFGVIELMPTAETLTISYDIRVPAGTQKYWTLRSSEGEEFILENTGVIEVPSVDRFTLERKSNVPETFTLHQNFPNPFNPITTLSYDLPKDSDVRLTVYDMLGQEVITLVNSNQQAGFKSVQWNATDPMGRPVSAGVYLYKIEAEEFAQTRKMVLLK